jgi:hypothetical protein
MRLRLQNIVQISEERAMERYDALSIRRVDERTCNGGAVDAKGKRSIDVERKNVASRD